MLTFFSQKTVITSKYFLKEWKPSFILNGKMVPYFLKNVIFFCNFEVKLLYLFSATASLTGLISRQCNFESKFTILYSHSSEKVVKGFTVTIIYDILCKNFFNRNNSS